MTSKSSKHTLIYTSKHSNTMNTTKNDIDEDFVRDLYLSAVNDGMIYDQCGKYCIVNLQKKVKRGVFDASKAPRLFELEYLRLAREHYNKAIGADQWPYGARMNRAEKELFGKLVFEFYEEQIMGGVKQ